MTHAPGAYTLQHFYDGGATTAALPNNLSKTQKKYACFHSKKVSVAPDFIYTFFTRKV